MQRKWSIARIKWWATYLVCAALIPIMVYVRYGIVPAIPIALVFLALGYFADRARYR